MADIVERLREGNGADWQTAEDAADTITTLRAEVERWEKSSIAWQHKEGSAQEELSTLRAENAKLREALAELANPPDHCTINDTMCVARDALALTQETPDAG